jgi:hypothetical protein
MICSAMNAHNAPPAPATDTDAPEAWERALLDRQLQTLDRLAQMGMAIAGAIQQRATDPAAADAAVQHAAMDFARVSRAVRMTLALQSKLVRDFKTPAKAAPADKDDDKPAKIIDYEVYWADGEPLTPAARRRVLRESVRGVAQARGLDAETVERLEAEAVERLEREDLSPDGRARGDMAFRKIVPLICEALGLNGDEDGALAPEPCSAARPEDWEPPSSPSSPSQPRAAAPTWLSG